MYVLDLCFIVHVLKQYISFLEEKMLWHRVSLLITLTLKVICYIHGWSLHSANIYTTFNVALKLIFCISVWQGIRPASRSLMVLKASPQYNSILVNYTCNTKKTFHWPFQTNYSFKETCKPACTAVWSWSDPSSAKRKLFDCGAGFIHSHPDRRHAGYSVPVCLISWSTGSASDPRLRPSPFSR